MGIVLETIARNAACDAIVDLIDVGGAGTLEFKSADSSVAGTNEVATVTFGATAFGAASTGVATANSTTDDTSAAGGTVTHFTIFNGSAAPVFRGTVTATGGGGDIEMSTTTVGATDTVSITSLTATMPTGSL
jgi:hypothetical protein